MKRSFEFVQKAIGAITEENGWEILADSFVEYYDFRSAALFAYPLNHYSRPYPFMSSYLSGGGCEILEYFLSGGDDSDQAVYARVAQSPRQVLLSEAQIFGVADDGDLAPCTERDVMFRVGGIKCRLSSVLNKVGPWTDILALHPTVSSQAVPLKIVSDMNLLLPVLAKALNTFRAFETLKHHFGMRLQALDYLGFGAALVDETGMVAYSNAYAQEVWAERDGVHMSPEGRIGIQNINTAAKFSGILKRACAPGKNLNSTGPLVLSVPRISERASYFIKAHSLTDSDNETDIHFPFSLVFLIDPTRSGSLSCEGIENLHLLTQAETDICERLLAGATTDQIAQQRGVSLHTVRQQIKSILSKLQCRNRNELFHVALTSHLPVREMNTAEIPPAEKHEPRGHS